MLVLIICNFPFSNEMELADKIENGGLNGGLKSLFEIIKNNPVIKAKMLQYY